MIIAGETVIMRSLLALCLWGAVLGSVGASSVQAQPAAYPTRPVKLVVAWSPGGATDILARIVAVELAKHLGQPVVVENRPGANGTIGQTQVATSAPDGYTLILATNSTYAIADHLYKNLPYKLDRDFVPISLVAASPLILAASAKLDVKSVKDLIELARKEPGRLNFPTGGNGTTSHLATELFMALTNTSMTHVPYKSGGPATMALVAGEVDAGFVDLGVAMPFVSAGTIKPLGVTGTGRSTLLPDVPAISEAGIPQFEATTKFACSPPPDAKAGDRQAARRRKGACRARSARQAQQPGCRIDRQHA